MLMVLFRKEFSFYGTSKDELGKVVALREESSLDGITSRKARQ
jgi:hypothetical protein